MGGPSPTGRPDASASWIHAWITGIRPKTLYAAVAPVTAGGGLALADGVFSPLPFTVAFTCAILIQIGTNLANDYSDYVRGADADDRLGSTRVTQAGLLPPRAVRRGAAVTFGLAVALGAYLVTVGGWPILAIGLASIAAGISYTGGPWPFGYHGLGDLFVFVFFGLVAVGGTYYVQALALPADLLLAGSGMGALITAILVVNNLRDVETDRRTGKRTLAVRLGARGTQVQYALLLFLAALAPPIGWEAFGWSPGVLLAWIAFLLAPSALRTVLGHEDPRTLNPILGRTALMASLYGILFAVGINL